MTSLTDKQKYEIIAKLSLLALYIVFGIDITIGVVAYFIAGNAVFATGLDSVFLRNVFLVVTVTELAAMQFIKKALLGKIPPISGPDEIPYQLLSNITYIIAAMCVSIALYGFILVLLGGVYDSMLLFLAISLIGFQLFRLRKRDLDRLDF